MHIHLVNRNKVKRKNDATICAEVVRDDSRQAGRQTGRQTDRQTDCCAAVVSCVMWQGADQCDACRHVQDGPYCVAECPKSKYANASGICLPCHPNCTEEAGCTGPLDTVGPGACNSCALVHFDEVDGVLTMRCLQADTECADGFYRGVVPEQLRGPGVGKLASYIFHLR